MPIAKIIHVAELAMYLDICCTPSPYTSSSFYELYKGQLISKWFLGVVDFLQKTNENKSTWGIIVVKLNLFVHFLEEIDDPKKPFQN